MGVERCPTCGQPLMGTWLRRQRRVSIRTAAASMGVGFITLSRAESGTMPDWGTVRIIARYYGVPVKHLAERMGWEKPN